VVAPFAGFSALLTRTFGDSPNPYFYVLSWLGLGLVGMLATDGFALYLASRNRKSIRAAWICLTLFAMSYLPVIAAVDSMRRTVAALRTAQPAEEPPNLSLQRTRPAAAVSATIEGRSGGPVR